MEKILMAFLRAFRLRTQACSAPIVAILLMAVLAVAPLIAQNMIAQNVLAQSVSQTSNQADRARAAMQASLEKQRASVTKQLALMNPVAQGNSDILAAPLYRSVPQFITPDMVRWSGPAVQPVDVVSMSTVAAFAGDFSCDPLSASTLSQLIGSAARTYMIDPALVREVARQESSFRPCSVSSKGAQGLMQLMPATQQMLNVENPFDPEESLFAGAKLLRDLLNRYQGDLSLALSAYNAGPTRVDKTYAIPEIPETQNYVATILERLGTLTD